MNTKNNTHTHTSTSIISQKNLLSVTFSLSILSVSLPLLFSLFLFVSPHVYTSFVL
jgi:hypothetical protein